MKIQTFETTKGTEKRLAPCFLQSKRNHSIVKKSKVHVVSNKTYQKIIGFGGAFTEAAAHVYAGLDEPKKQNVTEAYFDKEKGNAY
ncbi:MAG: hypothetical protein KAR21_21475, partial [Spirochaetales bacterium]|nr:hypothetical protein [Spirochaetales bacterium]